MTVAELIEKLREMPQDAVAYRSNRDEEFGYEIYEIDEVYGIKGVNTTLAVVMR